ncbi:hypothetical protein Esti_003510 [Eimeria stiedai]
MLVLPEKEPSERMRHDKEVSPAESQTTVQEVLFDFLALAFFWMCTITQDQERTLQPCCETAIVRKIIKTTTKAVTPPVKKKQDGSAGDKASKTLQEASGTDPIYDEVDKQ